MKRILLIAVLVGLAHWLGAQITTNTNFKINSNNPIDNRMTIAELGDTSTITFVYEGLLVHVNDADTYYKYNGATWEQFDPGGTMTAEQTKDSLETLSGANRLDISAIKNDTVTRLIQDSILVKYVDDVETDRDTIRTPGGAAAVSSVNGDTGAVTLDPDDLDDSATTNKFTTAGDISKLAGIESGATAPRNYYAFTGSEPDTSLLWIDQTTYDSTGVFEVKDYGLDGWNTVSWYDSVGNVFSNQPPIYAIITGQSNATPRNSGGDNTPSSYTSWWNAGEGKWTSIDLPAGWTTITGDNWWGMHFGRAAAELDNRIVKIIYVARGGRPISGWIDGGLEWTEIENRMDSSHVQRIDVMMWYQGESDYDRTIEAYKSDWLTVYEQFKALPEWTNETQVLVAQLNCSDGTDTQNGFLNTLAVDTTELTKVVHNINTPRKDAQHISVEGHRQLGRRMYLTFSGRQNYQPLPQGYSVSQDTMWDFSNTHLVAEDNDTIIAARNFYDGWNGNVRINDADSSGVSFTFPVVAYAHDGKEVITGIYGRFSSSAYVENDTLYFSKLPPYYVSQNTPFDPETLGEKLIGWWSTDTLLYSSGGKVDSIRSRTAYNPRALVQRSASNRPDTTGQMNGRNVISFTPSAWLEIDTVGSSSTGLDSVGGIYGGERDIYMAMKTEDAKGALFQGDVTTYYSIWDTLSSSGTSSFTSTIFINGVETLSKRDSLARRILAQEGELIIVQLRQATSAQIDSYLRIFDYANNLSGYGTTGEFAELIITEAQYSQVEESKIINYLTQKWSESSESAIVYSDVGKEKFRNPYGTGDNLDATIAAIKAATDAGSDDQTAAEVTYDNTTSGLTATDVKAAIDEVTAAIPDNISDLTISSTVDFDNNRITGVANAEVDADAVNKEQLDSLGTIVSDLHSLDFQVVADGDTLVLTNEKTLVLMDGSLSDIDAYIDGSAVSSGSLIYIKFGNTSTDVTLNRDATNDPGNFIAESSLSTASTLNLAGDGMTTLLKYGATWYQLH
jgi:hypothetical protein